MFPTLKSVLLTIGVCLIVLASVTEIIEVKYLSKLQVRTKSRLSIVRGTLGLIAGTLFALAGLLA